MKKRLLIITTITFLFFILCFKEAKTNANIEPAMVEIVDNAEYLDDTIQYKAINLNIANYKQYDSRWINTIIGESGKTIAEIGCLTTCFAMTESYRYGHAITPSEMANKLRYTVGGEIYWPSDYSVTTSSLNYLSNIYNILQDGKPVIFGSKTISGSQHWSVITGYLESDTLTANNFLINDPGSISNKTLADQLATHPVFYKYVLY